ncbi:response regulator [Tissierella sp. Yu-01]|uniref:response regulator transcription factor n=1 Tax=Tissierella sp. Yu-01 TaxID=3035694 RepID=UPI00240D754A|nr:response regulator [Tissierella sp. Yu-01]WFA08097.1 response regulator [Tissierella sp. Yu-01]
MIRVIIADDENRICRLIMKLIDWDELGMSIVGTANNGLEALELIEKESPDIVITDIRMPGYDGLQVIERAKAINKDLEFIIISGYSHFEYAKSAISYGVKDYLLKPINQEELLNTLLRVKGDIIKKKGYINLESEYKFTLENDRYIIRKSFLDNLIISDGNNFSHLTIEEINKRYYFHFEPCFFQIIALRLDQLVDEDIFDINNIMERTLEAIYSSLRDAICDIEVIIKKNNSYILMNYREEQKQMIKDNFSKVLADFDLKISQTKKVKLTIGFGKRVIKIKDIKTSYESAKLSIEDRIIKGIGELIHYGEVITDKSSLNDMFLNFSRKFVKFVERLDREGIKRTLSEFKKEVHKIPIGGREYKTLILDIANIYDLTLKSNNIKIDYENKEYKRLEDIVKESYSTEFLFDELLAYINTSLILLDEDMANKNLGQITQAKEYIEANYMNSITLEDVGAYIGFNPSYFSSLFKKETGFSFVEYLSKIRMEKAKELLVESDLRIQDICLMVGYNDVKYFSKLFIKYTGLKPKEYRKIFM